MSDADSQTSVEQQLKSEKSSMIYRKAVKKALEMEEESDKFIVERVQMNFALPPSVHIIFRRVDVPAPKEGKGKSADKSRQQTGASASSGGQDPYKCPTCGNKYRYIQEYQRWYCDTCKKYP